MRMRALHLLAMLAVAVTVFGGGTAKAFMTPEQRADIDMSRYTVTDRYASFVDIAARARLLSQTRDPQLIAAKNRLEMGVSCQAQKSRPVISGPVVVPSFYDDPNEWQVATQPLLDFEDMMSNLSGAWIATGDTYFAYCLVDVLEAWAKEDALHDFAYGNHRTQAWYAIESMIFSAGFAYSTVSGDVEIDPQRRQIIEDWLHSIAERHFSIEGSEQTCCNNHYYRRALYMTIIGVVTGDDGMFQEGLRAPIAALHDLDQRGAFQLAMTRGWRIIHYQNYSLLYLISNMQVAFRQGYDLFGMSVDGRGYDDAIAFLLRSMADPYSIDGLPAGEQDLSFTNDDQYFAWMEIWLAHVDAPQVADFVRLHRPIYNRGAGGHITLLFKQPETVETMFRRQLADLNMSAPNEGTGTIYPFLEKWKRQQ